MKRSSPERSEVGLRSVFTVSNSTTSVPQVPGLAPAVLEAVANPTQQVSSRIDIASIHRLLGPLPEYLARRFGVQVGRPSGADVPTECPQHKPGHTRSAHCHRWGDRWTFTCHRCGIRPVDVIDLLVVLGEAADRREAIRALDEELGADRADWHTAPRRQEPCPPAEPIRPMRTEPDRRIEGDEGERLLLEYVESRGWSIETARSLDLHAVRRNGEARIRHPFTANGKLYGAQDRSLGATQPKWLTTQGTKLIPYNLDGLDNAADHGRLVNVVEGPADAITLLDVFGLRYPVIGIPGASNWKSQWTRAVDGLRVVLIADNDEAGEQMRARVEEELGSVGQLRVPDEFGDLDEWRRGSPGFVEEFYQRHDDSIGGAS